MKFTNDAATESWMSWFCIRQWSMQLHTCVRESWIIWEISIILSSLFTIPFHWFPVLLTARCRHPV